MQFNFSDQDILNQILLFFEKGAATGFQNLSPHATSLLVALAIISICTTWTLYDGQLRLSRVISLVLKISMLFFLIHYMGSLNHIILKSFQYAGLTAAGATTNLDPMPSGEIQAGIKICQNLFDRLSSASIMSGGLGTIFGCLIAMGLTMFGFFIMALQILITKIEFNVFAALAVILIPFGAIKYTKFLFDRCITCVFAFGVKMMLMYFLFGLIKTLLGTPTPMEATSFGQMMAVGLTYFAVGFLVWKVPNMAAMMVQGSPMLDGGGITSTIGSTVGGAVANRIGSRFPSTPKTKPGVFGSVAGAYRDTAATMSAAQQAYRSTGYGDSMSRASRIGLNPSFASSSKDRIRSAVMFAGCMGNEVMGQMIHPKTYKDKQQQNHKNKN